MEENSKSNFVAMRLESVITTAPEIEQQPESASTVEMAKVGPTEAPPNSTNTDNAKAPCKRKRSVESDPDDGMLCSVCFDLWTSAGPHRLCCLKCGHIFGRSCVERWFMTVKTCPTCNQPAKKNDIRDLYATKLGVLDSSEFENAKLRIQTLEALNSQMKLKISLLNQLVECVTKKETEENTCKTIERLNLQAPSSVALAVPVFQRIRAKQMEAVQMDAGVCRVVAYSVTHDVTVVSQETLGPLWPGFGIRRPTQNFVPLHKKEIRDLAFHPTQHEWLLSVSLDQDVKILDITNNRIQFSWTCESQVWSCCWDEAPDAPPLALFVGTSRGRVYKFTSRRTISELPCPLDIVKPLAVCALKYSKRLNSLLCGRLSSVSSYTPEGNTSYGFQLLMEGKYSAMTFNEDSPNMAPTLVMSCRPSDSYPMERYIVYSLSKEGGMISCLETNIILGGGTVTQLTRPSLLPLPQGLLFVAYVETSSTVCGWYLGQQAKAFTIETNDFVRDILTVKSGRAEMAEAEKQLIRKLANNLSL